MEKTLVILKQCWIQANKRLWMNTQIKLSLPEEHLLVKSTMTRGLCTRRGKQITHEELTISFTGFMVEKLKKWHNW